jgi:hypothetical protein
LATRTPGQLPPIAFAVAGLLQLACAVGIG